MYTLLILFCISLIIITLIYDYNKFVSLMHRTNEAWADIDVALKRRYDLISNLVETVKGYATHEKGLFEQISRDRSQALGAKTVSEKDNANDQLSVGLSKIFAIAENYPKLASTDNFAKLQDELTNTENMIASSRRFYNGNVRDLNTLIDTFPNVILAGLFRIPKREFFQLDKDSERDSTKVTTGS